MSTETWFYTGESLPAQPRVGWKATLSALVRSPLILLLPLLALGLGARANWSWLAAEHERLEPWKVPIIWLGECVALFWYLQFSLRHTLA